MAHIVCLTSGLRGLLNASFELVARLQAAGHRVTYACPHDVAETVRAQGIRYVQLPAVDFSPAPLPERLSGPLGGLRSRLAEWLSAPHRRRAGVEALGMPRFRAFLEQEQPDLVLLDAELYEHCFTVYAAGIRLALLTPFFSTWKRPGIPPLQLDITPGEGWRGSRPGLELVWLRLRITRWLQIRQTSLRYAFTERRAVLRRYARETSFPLRWLEQYGWITLFNIRKLPVLSLTAREVEFPHRPPPWLHYVGPMVATGRSETLVNQSDRARLAGVYAEKAASGRPLLYCWLTTMDQEDRGFLPRVLEAVKANPEWLLIVGHTGGSAASLDGLPAHIYAFDYVPQIEVLGQADLCITHGGVNTLNECLTCAVPMLVYSTGFADKHGCAARLAYHGLAHKADIRRDDAAAIAERIASALADRAMKTRIELIRERLKRYRQDRVAETVVADLLKSPPTSAVET